MQACTRKQWSSQSKDSDLSDWVILRDIIWHNLLKCTPQLFSFCLGATCNKLASIQNRACWEFEDDIGCALCRKEETGTAKILAGCLKEGLELT